jgi:hypothetical protein
VSSRQCCRGFLVPRCKAVLSRACYGIPPAVA